MNNKILKKVELTRLNSGKTLVSENVIRESPLTVRINGKHYTSVMFLDKQQKEWVTGHLYVQGVIRRAEDIKSLVIKNHIADVTLGRVYKPRPPSVIESTLNADKEDVFNCVRAVLKSPVFAETEGVHSAGLFLHGKEAVCIAEDIGRHHALDKVIGAAILQGVPLSECLAASTGRMALEMVNKICRAGIPIVATKAAVTDQGVAIARKYGVTVIGFVREAGSKLNTDMNVRVFQESVMKIYCGAERVLYK
ncbi:MAG: formate dehydrogenase accessory sulfurtransferase FdhD [Dehalococcoidales bacterium]|jgi:FdhD protein